MGPQTIATTLPTAEDSDGAFFGPAAGSEPMYQLRRFRTGHHPADLCVEGTEPPTQPETKSLHCLPHCVPQAGSGRLAATVRARNRVAS
jgi:hypothetical protein